MDKEKEEESMPKDSLVVELTSWSITRKKRDKILRPLSKTKYHWIFYITKPCRGEEKAYSRYIQHLAPTMTQHSHIIKQSMSTMSCHVMSWVVTYHITIVDHVYWIQMFCKWNSKGHTWNVKSHVSWKVIGNQIVMRVVKDSPLFIYTPSLYELRTFHLGSSRKALERSTSSLRSKEWLWYPTIGASDVHCKHVSWNFYLIKHKPSRPAHSSSVDYECL